MKIRAILLESSSCYFRHWLRLIPAAIVFSSVVAVPSLVVDPPAGELVSIALSLPVVYVLQAIHIVDSAEERFGHPPTGLGGEIRRLRTRLKALLAAYGLMTLKVALLSIAGVVLYYGLQNAVGIVCAVVVFLWVLFLTARWSVITPVILLEDVGARQAFRRNRQLVHGHTIRVLGIVLVARLVPLIVWLAIDRMAAGAHGSEQVRGFLRDAISVPLADAFVAIVWTSAYFALRSERDEVVEDVATPATA
jgi:hypothetical protein